MNRNSENLQSDYLLPTKQIEDQVLGSSGLKEKKVLQANSIKQKANETKNKNDLDTLNHNRQNEIVQDIVEIYVVKSIIGYGLV